MGRKRKSEQESKDINSKEKPYIDKPPTSEEVLRVQKWGEWSMQPHTPDEIREAILEDSRCVCFTYLCEYSKIPGDFLEEFLVLSTCLLDKSNYEKDFDRIKNALFANLEIEGYTNNEEILIIENNSGTSSIVSSNILDRIDWKNFGMNQKIDLYTAERFGKFLPWDTMNTSCSLSQMYIDANKAEFSQRSKKDNAVTKLDTAYESISESDLMDGIDDFDDDFL